MKKLFAFLLITVMMLSMVACSSKVAPDDQLAFDNEPTVDNEAGTQSHAVLKEPPDAELLYGYGSVPLRIAGYIWHYPTADGTMSGTKADGLHPLDTEAVMEPILVTGALAKLTFTDMPDTVQVSCWPDTAKNTDAVPESVTCYDNAFDLKPGGYIYEIVASWEQSETGHYGTARYHIYIVQGETHSHEAADQPQRVENPITGYCGNTWTTLHINGKDYGFMYGNSVTLTDILVNLKYEPNMVCNCTAEFTADTEFGADYGINLTEGFVRCEKGQAVLTWEQINTIAEIIRWAETTNCQYPINH